MGKPIKSKYTLDYLPECSITQSDKFRCFYLTSFLGNVQVCDLSILIGGQVVRFKEGDIT